MPAPFWIQCKNLGACDNGLISEIWVWRGKDPRPTILKGDAYWQWQFSDSPYRNRGKGFSWTQALHDGLEGFHSTILHAGDDRFCVTPEHKDYAHVERIWNLVNDGVMIPDNF